MEDIFEEDTFEEDTFEKEEPDTCEPAESKRALNKMLMLVRQDKSGEKAIVAIRAFIEQYPTLASSALYEAIRVSKCFKLRFDLIEVVATIAAEHPHVMLDCVTNLIQLNDLVIDFAMQTAFSLHPSQHRRLEAVQPSPDDSGLGESLPEPKGCDVY